jgi:surface protein
MPSNGLENGILYENTTVIGYDNIYVSTNPNLVIRTGTLTINANVFENSLIETISFPDTLIEINANAFKNCTELQTVYMTYDPNGENILYRYTFDESYIEDQKTTVMINFLNGDTVNWAVVLPIFKPSTKDELQTAVGNWVLPNGDSNKDSSTYNDVPINEWDTSLITDMSLLFTNKTTFNDDISNWDVSSVTDMSSMFENATSFNTDISNWDVSSVTNMISMFENAPSFNTDISNWDVSSVTNMHNMFSNASYFNQDINNWDMSSVTNMLQMFRNATSFNQDLNSWDVSSVTNMHNMFGGASSFNGNISNWNVSSVNTIWSMFRGASSFNGNISNWNVSSVTNHFGFETLFQSATSFNGDISTWDVSSVTNMSHMFTNASSFNQDISAWDVSSVTNMSNMFREASSFNQDISNWDVSSVINGDSMFDGASSFDQDLSSWYTYSGIVYESFSKTTITGFDIETFPSDGNITTPANATTIANSAFSNCSELISITMTSVVDIGVSAFYNCTNLTSVVFSSVLESIGGDAFMFCTSLTGHIELPSTVQSIAGSAFENCPNITEARMTYSLDGVPTLVKYVYPDGELHKTAPMTNLLAGNTANWIIVSTGQYINPILNGVIYESDNYLTIVGFDTSSFPTNGIVYLHNNSEIILDSAFNGCSTMKSIIIPPSVTTVGNQAFDNCTQLNRVTMYKSNILYIYTFTESSDKTLIIQTFLSSSASELDEGWKKSTVISSSIVNDTDIAIEIPTIRGLYVDEISSLVSTIFETNSELFDLNENKISFSAPGNLFENTELAIVNPTIASQSVTMFSSDISSVIDWSPTTTSNAYVLLNEIEATLTINMDDGISVVLIKGESTTSVTINDGDTLQYTTGDTFNIGTTTCIIGSLIMYTEIPEPIIFSNICVRGSELVRTDNMGYKPIAALSVKDTLQGKKIQRIYRTKLKSGNLVLIKKYALGLYRPFKDTVVTKDHKIKVRQRLIPARQLITNMSFPDVVEYKYNGEILYNVLMKNHNVDKTMIVNGLVCETLSGHYMSSKPIQGCVGFSNQKIGN